MAKRCMGCMKTYDEEFDVCPHCGYIEGTPAKEAYHIVPGTILHEKYTVGRVVGYGGFGVTYAAWDNVLNQKVAIKEYLPSEFATRVPGQESLTVYSGEKEEMFSVGREKFSEEARRLAQFNNVEGVVEIKDTFKENNTAYIVMEFLEGETLKERLNREGKVPPEEALQITREILGTLEEVHKGDIIHRDIAPDNIFLCSDGRVKLLDFGASRYATVQHSKSLSVILKEGYAPEEQYRSKGEQGPWSDVYAVGATLYKMLTGVTPEDAMERAENDKLKPVSKYGVKLSKEVDTALMNAMNVFAEDRTQTATEFKTELDADAVKRKERTRKKIDIGKWPLWSKILIGCICVALVGAGVLLSKKSEYALEEGKTYVPEIINMKDEKAKKTLEKYDLTFKIIGQEKSEKVEMAKVMTQYPDAGRVVNVGELVEAKISAGSSVEMVDLSGKSEEEVVEILETMGFDDVEIVEEESAAAEGTIVSQSIAAGKDSDVSGKVTITVSTGLGDVNDNKTVAVPDLTNMSFEKALEKAEGKNLYVIKGTTKESSKPAGTVISQDKKAGSKVKEGTTITVTISAGEKKVEVPYVEYLSEAEAKRLLAAYNLSCSVSYKHSDTVQSGLVMSQSTEAGRKVKPGTKISLVVSEGREKISVPNVTGKSYTEAEEMLLNKGFRYSIKYVNDENVAKGKVISYSPRGKQEKGTKVTLTVSEGREKISVPNVTGKSYTEAEEMLLNKGFRYNIKYANDENVAKGKVISYSPSGKQEKGTKITLTVSDGREQISVPNVTGKSYTEAEDTLLNKGFKYSIKYVNDENVAWGKVMAYSPSGKQEKGTKVTLTVSKGTAGKLVSEGEYKDKYSDSSKYSASPRYRYATRSKQYTYSGKESLDGYNNEGKEVISSVISKEYYEKGSSKVSVYSDYAEETTYVNSVTGYRSYMYVCKCGKISWKSKSGHCGYCKSDTTNALTLYTKNKLYNIGLKNGGDGDRIYPYKTVKTGKDSKFGEVYLMYFKGNRVSSYTAKNKTSEIYLWPANNPSEKKLYKKKTEKYRYKYSYWSSWSSYGKWTTKQKTSETVKEDTTVMYYVAGKEPN